MWWFCARLQGKHSHCFSQRFQYEYLQESPIYLQIADIGSREWDTTAKIQCEPQLLSNLHKQVHARPSSMHRYARTNPARESWGRAARAWSIGKLFCSLWQIQAECICPLRIGQEARADFTNAICNGKSLATWQSNPLPRLDSEDFY